LIDQLISIDKEVFLALNGCHSPFWDFIMWWVSDKLIWIPFYLFLLFLVWRKYKKQIWIVLIAIAVLITLTDQTHLHLFKNVFERLRPTHDPSLDGLVHSLRNYYGGRYGFVSGHSANSFAIATFMAVLLGKSYKYFTLLILLWAATVAYSRIYLGVHFPGDVLCGALLGTIFGVGLGFVCKQVLSFKPFAKH
jgi:undecaprenyl-diphosphatase